MSPIPIAEQIAAARRVVDLKFGGFMGDQTEAFQAATRAALATLERTEKLERIAQAARPLWDAHGVYVSNGATNAVFNRHILPIIKDIKTALDASEGK